MGMPIATDPVTMLPDKLASLATLFRSMGQFGGRVDPVHARRNRRDHEMFEIVRHDRTVHHR